MCRGMHPKIKPNVQKFRATEWNKAREVKLQL